MNEIEKIKSKYGEDAIVEEGKRWNEHRIFTVSFPGGDTGGLIYLIDGVRRLTYNEVAMMYDEGYLFNDDQE